MSLLSPRNLLAPFSNTVNVIAIILVVFLFAVFRFSMGHYQVVSSSSGARQPAAQSAQASKLDSLQSLLSSKKAAPVLPPVAAEAPTAVPQKAATAAPRQGLDLMKEIEALDKPQRPQGNTAAPGGDNLSDVEKALGLR